MTLTVDVFCVDIKSVIKSVLQTSGPGSGNLKERSGDADFALSESSGHRADNWENRGECGQISALAANGTLCIWDGWKTIGRYMKKKNTIKPY